MLAQLWRKPEGCRPEGHNCCQHCWHSYDVSPRAVGLRVITVVNISWITQGIPMQQLICCCFYHFLSTKHSLSQPSLCVTVPHDMLAHRQQRSQYLRFWNCCVAKIQYSLHWKPYVQSAIFLRRIARMCIIVIWMWNLSLYMYSLLVIQGFLICVCVCVCVLVMVGIKS